MRVALVLAGLLSACGDDARPSDTQADSAAADTRDTAEDVADTADTADTAGEVTPPWYQRAVMYEVFVRSFQDSDGDGIGDLRGLVSRLDYLNDGAPGGDDLEVDGLWLMPIFTSNSYHGYDVVDYRAIDPDYGSLADFDALVAACEARGMRVVLDLVMNHTSAVHPWFLASRSSASDPHRNWYVWRSDDPGWKQPFGPGSVWHAYGGSYYYGLFSSGMPDLNYREPAVVAEMTDVARSWLERGAAGFRLDAARYLVESADGGLFEQPETHAFWRAFRAELEASHDLYLVGEVWTGRSAVATYYGDGKELHQAFDFDLENGFEQAIAQGNANRLKSELTAQASSGAPWSYSATFLSNHDIDRLSVRLDDEEQRAAAVLLMTLPGTPYLYYGDELGMKPSPKLGDEAKRGPMAWTGEARVGFTTGVPWLAPGPEADTRNVQSALADDASLLRKYQALVRLRHQHPALQGDGLVVLASTEPAVFAMLRTSDDEVLLVVVNLGSAAVTPTLDVSAASLGPSPWRLRGIDGSNDELEVADPAAVPTGSLAPHEGRIWELSREGSAGPAH